MAASGQTSKASLIISKLVGNLLGLGISAFLAGWVLMLAWGVVAHLFGLSEYIGFWGAVLVALALKVVTSFMTNFMAKEATSVG